MTHFKMKIGVRTEPFIHGATGAGEGGIIIVVYDHNSLFRQAGSDEFEADTDGIIEITVEKSKGDFVRKIRGGELIEPGFFDNDSANGDAGVRGDRETVFAEFGDHLALGDAELASLKVGTHPRKVSGGFGGEASEGIVEPEGFGGR